MRERPPRRPPLPTRLAWIVGAAAVLAWAVISLPAMLPPRPPAAAVVTVIPAAEPIDAEALPFRTQPRDVAVEPGTRRRATAHPRTLATYRGLRAYPGAPPRVPHGITAAEGRTSRCNTCHQRGGFAQRFEAYAPLTPHPELANCLQCHLADDALVGVALPGREPEALCRQCHVAPSRRASLPPNTWQPGAWPAVGGARGTGSPPPIPHELTTRGNCLACHMGPAAVAEVRTPHPERANCRQCHVESGPGGGYVRPTNDDLRRGAGGLP